MKRLTEPAHLALVARLPCCAQGCGQHGVQVHHLIGRNLSGTGQKVGDWYTIPLCQNHHTGSQGIHALGWRDWEHQFGSQIRLHEETLELLYSNYARHQDDILPF